MDEHQDRAEGAGDDSGDATGAPAERDAEPAFGPGGYLPERASRRARKIVLRAPMGIQWVVGALVVGVVVAVAGVLLLRDGPPGDPYVALDVVDPTSTGSAAVAAAGLDAVYVGVGRPRIFAIAGPAPAYCPESGLLEAADGAAWRVTGRGLGGTPSLAEHPTIVHDGVLWVDPTRTLEPLAPDPSPAETACTPTV